MRSCGVGEGHGPVGRYRTSKSLTMWVSVAMLAAIGLFWFGGAIVWPLWQVESTLSGAGVGTGDLPGKGEDVVERLGGADNAARKLRLYFRAPGSVGSHKVRAVLLMGYCEDQCVDDLFAVRQHSNPQVRNAVWTALYHAGPHASQLIPNLIECLGGDDKIESVRASRILSRIGAPAVDPLVYAVKHEAGSARELAVLALSAMREQTAPILVDLLKEDSHEIVALCARALGFSGSREVVPHVVGLLDHNSDRVRGEAVRALGNLYYGRNEMIGLVLPMLHDTSPWVRASTCSALRMMSPNDTKILKKVSLLLDDNSPDVRLEALNSLSGGKYRSPEIASTIRRLARDKNAMIQSACAFYLVDCGEWQEEGVKVLVRNALASDPKVAEHAVDLLGDLGTRAQSALPDLKALRRHRTLPTRVRYGLDRAIENIESR